MKMEGIAKKNMESHQLSAISFQCVVACQGAKSLLAQINKNSYFPQPFFIKSKK